MLCIYFLLLLNYCLLYIQYPTFSILLATCLCVLCFHSKGYKVVYLITDDKQKFYEHLGYEYCSPVVAVSSNILPEELVSTLVLCDIF